MKDETLLPCPFCGSTECEAFAQDEEDCPYQSAIVRCFNCDAQSAQMVGKDKISRAIAAWNKRPAIQSGNSGQVPDEKLPLNYLQGQKDGLEWAAQTAEASHPNTGDWLYDDPIELAKAIRKGPDMPSASDGWRIEAKRQAEIYGQSFVVFRNGEEPQCADPTKVVISFTDKGLGHDTKGDGWIPVSERMPEPGVLVLVYAPPQPCDHPGSVRIGFDFIDPDGDDPTYWFDHGESYEHFCMVACDGMVGPTEKAPYTHWQPLPNPPEGV